MFPVNVSARHVHLSEKDAEILFGPGHELGVYKPLLQPGQYAAHETVEIRTPKGSFGKVRVLGPYRSHTQVEISLSDARVLGIKPPVRESGDLHHSASVTLVGPKGSVELLEGVIVAKAHIHMSPFVAEKFNVHDKEKVFINLYGSRPMLMEAIVRVNEFYALECHIDTDEANAAGLPDGGDGYLHSEDYYLYDAA